MAAAPGAGGRRRAGTGTRLEHPAQIGGPGVRGRRRCRVRLGFRAGEAAELCELGLHAAQAVFEAIEAFRQLGHTETVNPSTNVVNAPVGRRWAPTDERRFRPLVGGPIRSRHASTPPAAERLPQQYFVALLGRVAAAAAAGRRRRSSTSGAATPSRAAAARRRSARARRRSTRRPRLRADPRAAAHEARRSPRATATSTASTLDPRREVALVPGTKTAIVELALASATRATRCCCPTRTTPTIRPGPALAGAASGRVPLQPTPGWAPDLDAAPGRGRALPQLPVEPVRSLCAAGRLRRRRRLGAAHRRRGRARRCVHRHRLRRPKPESFLATPGAKEIGVEMWSMSKTYGMAGWRIGFVVGNAEIVERINLFNDHNRVGIFAPLQAAAIAALEGPQDSVAERVAAYERRRDAIAARCPSRPSAKARSTSGSAPGRADRRAAARRAPCRRRAGRGLRPERRRLGASLARRHRRDDRARRRTAAARVRGGGRA